MAYLVSLPVLLAGVGASFLASAAMWPFAAIGPAELMLAALAHILSSVDPDVGRYPWSWYRLVFGAEIPRAWRTLRG